MEIARSKIEILLKNLRAKSLTVGFAESCTGGRISSLVTGLPGVSDTFLGSVVSYSDDVKRDILQVPVDVLQRQGAVSEESALWMARGACRVLKVKTAAAVTGIAGPDGGSPDKPVGTVCFAVKGPNFERVIKKLFHGDRAEIQSQSAEFAIDFLNESLINN